MTGTVGSPVPVALEPDDLPHDQGVASQHLDDAAARAARPDPAHLLGGVVAAALDVSPSTVLDPWIGLRYWTRLTSRLTAFHVALFRRTVETGADVTARDTGQTASPASAEPDVRRPGPAVPGRRDVDTVGPRDGQVLVRFELPASVQATTASVCGDFNGWQPDALPMVRRGDGRLRAEVVLPAGGRRRFRYLLDGHRWENDPAADGYVPNGLGSDDSVVDLTAPGSPFVIGPAAVEASAPTR